MRRNSSGGRHELGTSWLDVVEAQNRGAVPGNVLERECAMSPGRAGCRAMNPYRQRRLNLVSGVRHRDGAVPIRTVKADRAPLLEPVHDPCARVEPRTGSLQLANQIDVKAAPEAFRAGAPVVPQDGHDA